MSNELQIPEYLKGLAPAASQDLNAAIASSISVPRLSLRGKVFRFIENGEEIKKSNTPVDVIILGVEPEAGRMIKTYYEKGYQPGNTDPPDCASHDGLRPSPWVNKPQAEFCQACKWNAFGSATSPNGKPTKKCRDAKQLWLLRTDDPQGLEGVQYGLNVSVSSLKAFSEYGRKLQANGLQFSMVITKLTFADSEFPQLEFEVAGFVSEAQIQATLKLTQSRPWRATAASLALAAPSDHGPATPTMVLPGQTIPPQNQAVPPGTPPQVEVLDKAANKPVDDLLKQW